MNVAESPQKVQAYAERLGINYPVVLDRDSAIVAHVFDERNEAVRALIAQAIHQSSPRSRAPFVAVASAQQRMSTIAASDSGNHLRWSQSATLTRPMRTGTSTSGPITAAKAAPWAIPKAT